MPKKAVYFTKTNARILSNDAIDDRIKNLVINPDLSSVAGVPPHHWVLKEGKIAPMNKEEIAQREMLIHECGVINEPEYIGEIHLKSDAVARIIEEAQGSKKFDIKMLVIVSIISVAVILIMFIIGSKYV